MFSKDLPARVERSVRDAIRRILPTGTPPASLVCYRPVMRKAGALPQAWWGIYHILYTLHSCASRKVEKKENRAGGEWFALCLPCPKTNTEHFLKISSVKFTPALQNSTQDFISAHREAVFLIHRDVPLLEPDKLNCSCKNTTEKTTLILFSKNKCYSAKMKGNIFFNLTRASHFLCIPLFSCHIKNTLSHYILIYYSCLNVQLIFLTVESSGAKLTKLKWIKVYLGYACQ